MTLTDDQQRALAEILAVAVPGNRHLLTGYAGTGKTTLMQAVTRALPDRRKEVVLCAPTHKAVAVLASKMREAGMPAVPCVTVHRLLSLRPKRGTVGEVTVFERDKMAQPVSAHVVIVDECSMLSVDLMKHIRRHLAAQFVLFVGDPAQLPPVGEEISESLMLKQRSHLSEVVRQASDNPVLAAANVIRESQNGAPDWSWIRPAEAKPFGVYMPGERASDWMRKAFTSPSFKEDPDRFRYLCWTNRRVIVTNRTVRQWIYGGDTPTPFMPGERVLFRSPVVAKDTVLFSTNEEADVVSIDADTFSFPVPASGPHGSWVADVPSWRISLRRPGDTDPEVVHMPRDSDRHKAAMDRIIDEAHEAPARWDHRRSFANAMAELRHIYALTVHNSQGSTFNSVFVDVSDIMRREGSNQRECQQLFYVAMTRPTTAAFLVNA